MYEFRLRSTFSGIMGYGSGGTNVFVTACGEMTKDSEHGKQSAERSIAFWPGGGGSLSAASQPKRDYYIAGTMTNWEPMVMTTRKGAEDKFSFTMTLGENRWEMFQIWLDGDSKRCLHPGDAWGVVEGPEEVDLHQAWVVDGRPSYMWKEDGSVVEIAKPDTALIGTKYNIALRCLGQYRTVEWEKADVTEKEQEAIDNAEVKGSEADYFIQASFNDDLMKMTREASAPGRYTFIARPQRSHSTFQIVRNRDWNQVIYPAEDFAGSGAAVCGPDGYDMSGGSSWYLNTFSDGSVRIFLERTSARGEDSIRVWWEEVL
jgi:hypothetical protein